MADRRLPTLALLLPAALCGCTIAPKSFSRGIGDKAPLVRARASGMGGGAAPGAVAPALVGRLEDSDPAVRLAAHEELKKSTGQDFGFVPWADPAERGDGRRPLEGVARAVDPGRSPRRWGGSGRRLRREGRGVPVKPDAS